MKTKELKSLLEKMDYSVKRINGMIVIENEYGNVIATIEENTTFKFSTQYYAWNFISYSEQKIILSYIMGYAGTPIEDREEEKKFYLRHRWMTTLGGFPKGLRINIGTGTADVELMIPMIGYKNQFTKKEIEEIKEKFNTDLGDFKKIEVEE